jgi:hypothetical protein
MGDRSISGRGGHTGPRALLLREKSCRCTSVTPGCRLAETLSFVTLDVTSHARYQRMFQKLRDGE